MTKIKPDKIANTKIYSPKTIDISKKSEPTAISFSGTKAKRKSINIALFLPRLSKLECKPVTLLSYSEHCDTFTPRFKPPKRARTGHHVRYSRITASKVYDVLHTDINNPSTSLIESISEKSTITNTNFPALKWDIDNEKNSITQYTEFQRNQGYKSFKVNNYGLFSYRENSFLGHHLMLYRNVLAIQKKKC